MARVLSPATLVVADDHDVVRAGTLLKLGEFDWLEPVGEAADGREALQLIERAQPDLALLDLRLPGMDGIEIAREIRDQGLPTRVVIFSGFGNVTLATRAFESGALAYVVKDAPMSSLVTALQMARDGRRYLDPTLAAELLSEDASARSLSNRESEILRLMADGRQNPEIAELLGISPETVKVHVSHILSKFGADSRTEAVAKALRASIID